MSGDPTLELLQTDAIEESGPDPAARVLGWRPTTTFHALVRMMLVADLREAGLDPANVAAGVEPDA